MLRAFRVTRLIDGENRREQRRLAQNAELREMLTREAGVAGILADGRGPHGDEPTKRTVGRA